MYLFTYGAPFWAPGGSSASPWAGCDPGLLGRDLQLVREPFFQEVSGGLGCMVEGLAFALAGVSTRSHKVRTVSPSGLAMLLRFNAPQDRILLIKAPGLTS